MHQLARPDQLPPTGTADDWRVAERSEELGAGAIIGMLLGSADGGVEKHGQGEGRDAEGDEEVVPEEQEQEMKKDTHAC